MSIVIRHARVEDAVPCARILGDWFTATAWLPRLHTPAEDLAFLRQMIGRDRVTVAAHKDIAVGFMALDGSDLSHLYVDAAWRGQGIGGQLLQKAQASRDQLALWCFQANEGARAFYERHGFEVAETTDGADNEEGVPDMRYEWRAAP